MSDTWLTRTWQRRLTRSGGALHLAAKTVGFTACTIVAFNIIWGWITDEPIDVAGPARATVNHTDYIKSYAENCISRLLTTTSDQRASLSDCWTANDLQSLPTTVPVIVDYARANKIALADAYPEAEQWQVVVEVSERPYATASPRTTYRDVGQDRIDLVPRVLIVREDLLEQFGEFLVGKRRRINVVPVGLAGLSYAVLQPACAELRAVRCAAGATRRWWRGRRRGLGATGTEQCVVGAVSGRLIRGIVTEQPLCTDDHLAHHRRGAAQETRNEVLDHRH